MLVSTFFFIFFFSCLCIQLERGRGWQGERKKERKKGQKRRKMKTKTHSGSTRNRTRPLRSIRPPVHHKRSRLLAHRRPRRHHLGYRDRAVDARRDQGRRRERHEESRDHCFFLSLLFYCLPSSVGYIPQGCFMRAGLCSVVGSYIYQQVKKKRGRRHERRW